MYCMIKCVSGAAKEESKPKEAVVQEQLLMTLESAYPNILPLNDLAEWVCHICTAQPSVAFTSARVELDIADWRMFVCSLMGADESAVSEALAMLQGRNLIMQQEPGKWVRKVLDDKTGEWRID